VEAGRPTPLEQEVKLAFESAEAARQSIESAGGRLVVSRRLLEDTAFDTDDLELRKRGTALRLRRDAGAGIITVKGPIQPGPVKSREEIETSIGDAAIGEAILAALGYRRWYRSQKYREDFELGLARLMIDETPIGVFVEIEGTPDQIADAARRLGRTPADYILDSYPALFQRWCDARGIQAGEMLFR
jgi:adenylate cyclase class 2